MVETILINWKPVLAIIGGVAGLTLVVTFCLVLWRKSGGGDIKAGIVDIDVDGKTNEK